MYNESRIKHFTVSFFFQLLSISLNTHQSSRIFKRLHAHVLAPRMEHNTIQLPPCSTACLSEVDGEV